MEDHCDTQSVVSKQSYLYHLPRSLPLSKYATHTLQITLFPGMTIFSSDLTPLLTRVKRGQDFFLPTLTDSSSESALQTFRMNPVVHCIPVYRNHHESQDFEVISHNQTLIPTLFYICPNPTPPPYSPSSSTVPSSSQGFPSGRSHMSSTTSLEILSTASVYLNSS